MKTVSHHFLRRTARKRRRLMLEHASAGYSYVVERSERGPFRWRVVQVRLGDG